MHKTLLVPVLYGEGETQILIADDICLPEPTSKIIEVKVHIRNLEGHVCKGKVLVQGTLHKQIFFVNRHDLVQHYQTERPFSGLIEVPCAAPGMGIKLLEASAQDGFEHEHLIGPTQLHEKHIVNVRVAVFREETVCVAHHHKNSRVEEE